MIIEDFELFLGIGEGKQQPMNIYHTTPLPQSTQQFIENQPGQQSTQQQFIDHPATKQFLQSQSTSALPQKIEPHPLSRSRSSSLSRAKVVEITDFEALENDSDVSLISPNITPRTEARKRRMTSSS